MRRAYSFYQHLGVLERHVLFSSLGDIQVIEHKKVCLIAMKLLKILLYVTTLHVNGDPAEEGAIGEMQSSASWSVYKGIFYSFCSLLASLLNYPVNSTESLKDLECGIIYSSLHVFIKYLYFYSFKLNEPIVFEPGGGILFAGSIYKDNDEFLEVLLILSYLGCDTFEVEFLMKHIVLWRSCIWNLDANLIILNSFVGVGCSYLRISLEDLNNGDVRIAVDFLAFLLKRFELFPEYKGREFHTNRNSCQHSHESVTGLRR